MPAPTFDRPVPDLTGEKDAQTLAVIERGIAQLDAGQGIPLAGSRTYAKSSRSSVQGNRFPTLNYC
jgi:hypothetical protein